MQVFEAKPKQWGNSLGITIPSNIVKEEGVSPEKKIKVIIIGEKNNHLKKLYGLSKHLKIDAQKAKDELREEW